MDIYEFLMYSFVSVVFTCAFVLIVSFVRLYTEGINDVNYIVPTFAYLSVIAMAIQCIRQPYLTIVQAAGHYKQTRNGAYAEAIINIVLSVALTFRYGLVGVTIGTLIANAFRTTKYVIYISGNIINRSIWKSIKTLLWLTVNFVIIVIILQFFLIHFSILTWMNWITAGCVCFAVSFVVTLVSAFIFQREKLIGAWGYVKKMLPLYKLV